MIHHLRRPALFCAELLLVLTGCVLFTLILIGEAFLDVRRTKRGILPGQEWL